MDIIQHRAVTFVLLFLICCCIVRQRRYWRELQSNRPSTSVRIGYKLATASAIIGLAVAFGVNSAEGWKIYGAVVLMLSFFCVKISFSPAILAVTIGIVLVQHELTGSVNFIDVWLGVASAVMWRFPEDVRAVYAAISFLWVISTFLRATDAAAAETPGDLDPISDAISTFGS